MIINNQFYIKNLKSVIFLGQSEIFPELIKINKSLKLNTLIISGSHQSKLIDKKIDYKIFNKLDNKFKKFIKSNVKIQSSIFVSLGARYIFKKKYNKKFFFK